MTHHRTAGTTLFLLAHAACSASGLTHRGLYGPGFAGGPISACTLALAAACPQPEKGSQGVIQCDICAGQHQHTLYTASCTAAEVQSWCTTAAAAKGKTAKRMASLWTWPNPHARYIIQTETIDKFGNARALTHIFAAAGHQILPQNQLGNASGWPFAVAGDEVTGLLWQAQYKLPTANVSWVRPALAASVAHAKQYGIKIAPTVGGPLHMSDARAFLYNATAVRRFTQVLIEDALAMGYAGYNFDWELGDACAFSVCGAITAADKNAMAAFLTRLAAALAPHGLEVSQDVGQAAVPVNTNVTAVRRTQLRLFGMGTYTCAGEGDGAKAGVNDTGYRAFAGYVQRGVAALGVDNYGAGIAAVNASVIAPGLPPSSQCYQGWVGSPPTAEQLRSRFRVLADAGVQAVSMLTGWPDPEHLLDLYLPYLAEFLAGGSFEAAGNPGLS